MTPRLRSALTWSVPAVGLAAVGLARLDRTGVVPLVQAGLPVVALCLGVSALALLRRPVAAVGTLACAAVLLAPVLPRPGTVSPGPGELRVLSLNTEFGQADPAVLVARVRELRPDVLVLVELTPQLWAALDAAGLRTLLPHASGSTHPGSSGTVVATRAPHECVETPGPCGTVVAWEWEGHDVMAQPAVRLEGGVVVKAVHPYPPLTSGTDRWRSEQEALARWVADRPGPLVLAGDFNSGPVHPVFRRLVRGMALAPDHQRVWSRTWPREGRLPAFVGIDHVAARGLGVVASGTTVVPGTDHTGVWATLRRTPG